MLQYTIMQRAFVAGILLAVITPLIGRILVLRRMSILGYALSHSSLAGVAAGLLIGVNPVLGATVFAIVAALGIEAIRKRIPRYSEMAIAIMMSAGVGLAGVLSGFADSSANFNSFLFGSIVSVSEGELLGTAGICILVFVVLLFFRREFFYLSFDENAARISGLPVKKLNFLFTLLTALTISAASRTIGTLLVSSMLVVPVACGMQLAVSYRGTGICAVGIAVVTTVAGLSLSYYIGVKPGGAIVLLQVLCFLIAVMWRMVRKGIQR